MEQPYMLRMAVLLELQTIPGQFVGLVHALAESLQFAHRSVTGRSQRSLRAVASTALSSASEGKHHCEIIVVTTRTTRVTR